MENKINLIPDIDWTKESLQFCSNYGKLYQKEDILSDHYLKICQGTTKNPFYISQKDNYISIKAYSLPWAFYRVSDYKAKDAAVMHLTDFKWSACTTCKLKIDDITKYVRVYPDIIESRIYKNRKVVSISHCKVMESDEYNQEGADLGEYYVANLGTNKAKIVNTDEEIEKCAAMAGQNSLSVYIPIFRVAGYSQDLRHHEIWGGLNDQLRFHADTIKMLTDFFNLDSEENKEVKKVFASKQYNGRTELASLYQLKTLLTIKLSGPIYDNKAEKAINFVKQIPEWDEPFTASPQADWYRLGDDIVLFFRASDVSWQGSRNLKILFAYNIKTKRRFYGEYNTKLEQWNFPIPSYEHIRDYCDLRSYVNGYGKDKEELPLITTVHCDDILDLFHGSNVEYLLTNMDPETQTIVSANCETTCVPVKSLITKNNIENIIFALIFSTSEPILEQFLKSKMFNLYLKGIEKWNDGKDWLCKNTTVTDKVMSDLKSAYNKYYIELEYLSKEKNLKKMLGMSMDQLRILDAKSAIHQYERCYTYSSPEIVYGRSDFILYGIERFLGTNLNALDANTFNKILDLVISHEGTRNNLSFTFFRELASNSLIKQQIIDNLNLQQKINLIQDLKGSSISYWYISDYLNMRAQLERIQSVRPDIPGIWDEKHYPLVPKAGMRFVPYFPNAVDPCFRTEFYSGAEMETRYRRGFSDVYERGDMKLVYNEDRSLLGISLNLNMGEMIKFLHDEISYWVTLYQDEAKAKLFAQAVTRSNILEWKDNTSGLEIVAPTNIADLKNEGHVLSHCVGTFVDAIIGGKENIVFLRRSDMPHSPFYTVEVYNEAGGDIRNAQIRQVHCYRNGDLTSNGQRQAYENSGMEVYNKEFDLIKFLQKWAKAKAGLINANSIRSCYGALCAVR